MRLRKRVAIKLLPRQHGFHQDWVGRFEREMQAIASLSHAGIFTATDAGEADGWHYLVMEYLDGLDLGAVIGRIGPPNYLRRMTDNAAVIKNVYTRAFRRVARSMLNALRCPREFAGRMSRRFHHEIA